MSCKSTSFQFYAGEDKTLELSLVTKNNGCSEIYPLVSTDIIQVTLVARPADLVFTQPRVTITSEPYGSIAIELTAAETLQLLSGAIIVEVTRASKKKIFVVDGGVEKLTISNC